MFYMPYDENPHCMTRALSSVWASTWAFTIDHALPICVHMHVGVLRYYCSFSIHFFVIISLVNIGKCKEKCTFLVITSHGVNVLKVDVIQLTASNI